LINDCQSLIKRLPAALPANVWMSRRLVRTWAVFRRPSGPGRRASVRRSALRRMALQWFAIGVPTPANQVDRAVRPDAVPCAGMSSAGGSSTR
jgi:hypothetical protein